MIYDRKERVHRLWLRKVRVGREMSWRKLVNERSWLIRRLGPQAVKAMSYRETVFLGVPWKEVLRMLPGLVKKHEKMLSQNDYVDLRGFVAWTAYPSPLWAQRIKLPHFVR